MSVVPMATATQRSLAPAHLRPQRRTIDQHASIAHDLGK
jgi:hypothetical protein